MGMFNAGMTKEDINNIVKSIDKDNDGKINKKGNFNF